MIGEIDGAGNRSASEVQQGTVRRPYVKPFVRNLDAVETEGDKILAAFESSSGGGNEFGHS